MQSQSIPPTVSRSGRTILIEYQSYAGIIGEESNIGSRFHILVTKDFKKDRRLLFDDLDPICKNLLSLKRYLHGHEHAKYRSVQQERSDILRCGPFSGVKSEAF